MKTQALYIQERPFWASVAPDIRNVKDAADAFESMLWQIVLKESFKSLPKGSFFNSGGEKGIYAQLVIWRLSDYISKTVDTDIGRAIYEKFSQGYRKAPSHPIYNKKQKTLGEVRHEG